MTLLYHTANRWIWRALALVLLSYLRASAVALDIQFNYADGFAARTDAVAGMERASRMWEAVLDDPVTVVIDVAQVPIGELGFSQAGTCRTPRCCWR